MKKKPVIFEVDPPTAARLAEVKNKSKFIRFGIRLALAELPTTAPNDPLACVHRAFLRTGEGEFCANCHTDRKDCEDFSAFFPPAMLFV